MSNGRLAYLYEKCVADSSTAEEREEFIRLMRLPENMTMAKQLLYKSLLDEGKKESVSLNVSEAIIQAILQSDATPSSLKIDETPVAENLSVQGKVFRMNWVRYAAAAIIVLGVGAYLWFARDINYTPEQVAVNPAPVVNDVAPGRNRAVLTLSDGSTIMLDDAANGNLTQQGGAQVVKLADGNLVYTAGENSNQKAVFNTMSTPKGGQYKLRLPDSSEVWLNAASSITYPTVFTENERKVTITGEAYFEIRTNSAKPFYVEANGMSIAVLGTNFNVNAYSGESAMKATLLEGSVKISNGGLSNILKPGQQAQVKDEGINIVKDVDVEEVIAWKNGYFQFLDADMQSIMKQLERWYDIEVSYEAGIPERSFSGGIQRSLPLSKVLTLLGENDVKFEINGKKLKVLK